MRMSLSGPRFVKSEGVAQLVRDGVERLRAVPGVTNTTTTLALSTLRHQDVDDGDPTVPEAAP